uniref:Uncharacterized protein n=1 Tax=Hucho hucho TaxID=62062 RepID=A0A4W5RFJ0_9TELE
MYFSTLPRRPASRLLTLNINSDLAKRLHQHNFTVLLRTMESTVMYFPAKHPSNTTVTSTTDNKLKETCKRKSEQNEEPEKSSSLKRRRGVGGKKQLRPGERYIPPPQKCNTGVSFSKENFDITTYYFEGGLRKVHSYYFDFKTYCKGRWIGKSLLEIFSSEFRAFGTPVDDLSITLRVSSNILSLPYVSAVCTFQSKRHIQSHINC